MDKLYMIIPAYNEAANIENTVREWIRIPRAIGGGARLCVIDDGSKDETFSILSRLADELPELEVIRKKNGGHGAAVLFGYKHALEMGADYVFQTDSDGQTRPREFAQFWKLRHDYDMVIGYRRGRKDGLSRIMVTRVLKAVIRLCFGVSVQDANTPFRLMTAESLGENISYIPEDFNLSNVVLSVIYAKRQEPVKYIPITFRQRQGGKNSINLKKIFFIGLNALRDFRRINKELEGELSGDDNTDKVSTKR